MRRSPAAKTELAERAMDREYIETHNVIERYHLGKLSEEEAAAFEDLSGVHNH